MWTAKIRFKASKALLGSLAIKHDINVEGYPISFNKAKNKIDVYFILAIHSPDKIKEYEFVKDLKNNKKITVFEHHANLVFGKIVESVNYSPIYNPNILHLSPWVFNKEDKTEILTVGSWKRDYLTKVIKPMEKRHLGELISISKKNIKQFFLINICPNLTNNQREALALAIDEGYYDYPKRKVNLKTLSKKMNIAFSTYHGHLRKAEQKILPFIFNEITGKK